MFPLSTSRAINAFICSRNHVYQAAYHAHTEDLGGVSLSYYGDQALGQPLQMEFLAVESDPAVVCARIDSCAKQHDERFVLNTFHAELPRPSLKAQYQSLGYEFVETAMIMELSLPIKTLRGWTHIHKIGAPDEIEFVNQGLSPGGEHIPPEVFGDPYILNFYAQLEHRAVGWTQLVTACDGFGCITQLYTLPVYRQRGIGTRMLRRVHQEANHLELHHMLLLASEMGMSLFRRAGYRPLAYLSVYRPIMHSP